MAHNKYSLSELFDKPTPMVTYRGETYTVQQYKRLIKRLRKSKELNNC